MPPVTYGSSVSSHSLRFLSLLCLAVFLYSLLVTAGSGLRLLDVPGIEWTRFLGAADDTRIFWLFLAITVPMGLLYAFIRRWKSPARNHLTLDEGGLTYVHMGMRCTWPWRDLESAEVTPGTRAGKLAIAGRFGWSARIGLLFMDGFASARRLTVTLPDVYETPIEDIVAGINDHRDRALGITRPVKDAAQISPLMKAAAAGQPIAFGISMAASCRRGLTNLVVAAFFLWLAFRIFPNDIPGGWPWNDPWSTDMEAVLIFGAIVLALLVESVRDFWANLPNRNILRLDPSGLAYRRQGRRHAWPWKDVSVFEYHRLMDKTLPMRRRVVTFTAPGNDRTWRRLRRRCGLPKAPPAVVIEEIYDTPIEEIAATLNAYRERALGGGAATDGPLAPESA